MATSIHTKRVFLGILLSLGGFLGNWFKVGLFFNVDFIFGSAFSMLAILVLGRTYGIISACIAASCTYLLWNHPWAIIIFTGEAFVVSWLYGKRQNNVVIYDLIYWICLGMPLVYLFYHLVMGFAVQTTLLVMLKQAINGLTNAILATLALLLYKFVKKPFGFKASYTEIVPVAMIAFALLPTLLLSVSAIRAHEETGMERLQAQVASLTQIAHKNVSGWVNDYHGHVQVLAKFIGDPNKRPFVEMQRHVEIIREANPALKGMGVFDNRSISVSYSPLEQDGKSNLGIDMSFRPHIAEMREDKKPYITDMLISKLGTPSPIVIFLAPIVISDEYKGYCSGVVETSNLAGFLTNLKTQDIHITLVDGQNKVIVSTLPDFQTNTPFSRPYLQPGQETAGYQPSLWQPEAKPNISPMQRWRQSFLFSAIPVAENCRWQLIVEAPLLPLAENISRYSLHWLGLQALLISVAVVLSSLLSHGFITNVRKLQLLTGSVPEKLDDASRIAWPNSIVAELAELTMNFRQMTSALVSQRAEQKNTEIALRASEEQLKAMFETASIGVAQTDPKTGQWVRVNQKMSEITGYSHDALLTMSIADITHPEDRDRDWEAFQSVVSNKAKDYRLEKRYIRKDSTIAWVNVNMTVIRDASGQPLRTVAMIEDITERKQAEEKLKESEAHLRESEHHFRTLANSGLALIWTSGLDKLCNYFNQSWLRYTGRTLEQELGNGWTEGVHPEDFDRCLSIYVSHFDRREPFSMEYRLRKANGEYGWILDLGNPYFDSEGNFNGYIGYCYDITERKRAEEETKILNARLQQAQKLEAIGTLAGGIAHDFNNILGAIVGYAEMIRDDFPPGSRSIHDIDQVLHASHRAKDLVKQILAFSRQEEDQKRAIQPAVIVKEAITLLRSSLPTTITIKQAIDPDMGMVLANPTQIHQVVMNLCTNAFHAMEVKGGELTIALQQKNLGQSDLATEPELQPGKYIELSIRDTGEGIPLKIRDKIFDPFFTTKEVGKGTGLGLSMVYSIVKSSGGSIACHSQVGEGTEFRILLPALEGDAAQEEGATELTPRGKEHILLIDDEEMLVELGQTMLQRLGYRVTTRNSSLDALTTFQNQPDSFDLIITDQTMPGMTGFDLARRILQIRPQVPILLCTGYSGMIDEDKALAAGIKGFAYKPLAKKDIGALIRKVLDGNNP